MKSAAVPGWTTAKGAAAMPRGGPVGPPLPALQEVR